MALLFLDVDGLKAVNDELGHVAGDRLLVEVADALQRRFRSEDQLARWGGDEFCVLLDGADGEGVEAIMADWAKTDPGTTDELPRLSLGSSIRQPGSSSSIEQLIDEADHAMYAGRGVL